jgi:hypothetical protein
VDGRGGLDEAMRPPTTASYHVRPSIFQKMAAVIDHFNLDHNLPYLVAAVTLEKNTCLKDKNNQQSGFPSCHQPQY